MKISKTGIHLRYLAALAFFLILFDLTLVSLLLIGVALYIEKDEWLSRQTIQAFFLKLFFNFITTILGGTTLISKFTTFQMYSYGSYYEDIFDYISAGDIFRIFLIGGLAIAVLVFMILGIIRTLKEQDAGVPFFSGLSYKMFGLIKPAPMPPQQPYYYQPNQQNPVGTNFPTNQNNVNQPQYNNVQNVSTSNQASAPFMQSTPPVETNPSVNPIPSTQNIEANNDQQN